MKNKIKKAREFIKNEGKLYNYEIIEKLKEVTDKAELVYNDVKIKRLKSKAAEQSMNRLSRELDNLIREAKTKKL